MNCFHCNYQLSEVYSSFQGYPIFDEHYNFEIYRFCSLNCGLKHIIDSKKELVNKLKHFFDFYNVSPKDVKVALHFNRLIYFGGDLDYETYRENFVTPIINNFYDYDNDIYVTQSYIDYIPEEFLVSLEQLNE
jgi:hypothetical protein